MNEPKKKIRQGQMNYLFKVAFGIFTWLSCQTIVAMAQNVLPPALLYPGDGDTLTSFNPAFSWSGSYVPSNGQLPTYDIKVAEILGNQSPEAAIQSNPAWFVTFDHRSTVFPYPLSAPFFERGKRYAWQVSMHYMAIQGEAVLPRTNQSEVYWFGVRDITESQCLTLLYQNVSETVHVAKDGELLFKFDPSATTIEAGMQYVITDLNGLRVNKRGLIPDRLPNQDYYRIALRQFDAFRLKANKGKIYVLKATESNGRTYSAKFSVN
jgi:hypothetical protein